MLKRSIAAAALLALLSGTGCWYGTFMGPRAAGVGKVRVRAIGNFPAYVAPHDRDKDNEINGDLTKGFGTGQARAQITYGAGPRFDIGIQGHYYSAGIHAKWWAAMRPEHKKKGMDFSPILFLDYVFETQRIAPKLSLVTGVPVSRIAQVYCGYEGFYGPDMTMIDDAYSGRIPFKKIPQEEYQDNIILGTALDYKDFGFTAEFGYPIRRNELDHSSTIWFGIGLWWGQALKAIM